MEGIYPPPCKNSITNMIFAKKFQPIRKHNWSSSHFEFPIERKVTNNVDDHQINISVKFAPMISEKMIEMCNAKCC